MLVSLFRKEDIPESFFNSLQQEFFHKWKKVVEKMDEKIDRSEGDRAQKWLDEYRGLTMTIAGTFLRTSTFLAMFRQKNPEK